MRTLLEDYRTYLYLLLHVRALYDHRSTQTRHAHSRQIIANRQSVTYILICAYTLCARRE